MHIPQTEDVVVRRHEQTEQNIIAGWPVNTVIRPCKEHGSHFWIRVVDVSVSFNKGLGSAVASCNF